MKCQPLWLLPRSERLALFEETVKPDESFRLAQALAEGELCHRCRQIHAALLQQGGDVLKVLAPRAGRAILHLAPLPDRRGDRRAADVGRRRLSAGDAGPQPRRAAAGAAEPHAVRAVRSARLGKSRDGRVQRSAQAPGRVVQVSARHRRDRRRAARPLPDAARLRADRERQREAPERLQGDPRLAVVQGAHRAGARAVSARGARGAEGLRPPVRQPG